VPAKDGTAGAAPSPGAPDGAAARVAEFFPVAAGLQTLPGLAASALDCAINGSEESGCERSGCAR
jgi:hypothetical protein